MYLIKYLWCFATLSWTYGQPIMPKFREDYTYSVNTKHYYKFHNDTNWWDAVAKCESESAQLFYPEDEAEAREVHKILQLCADNPIDRCYPIWIGISDLRLNYSFETVDGRPLDEVHHRWDLAYKQPLRKEGYHCVVIWDSHDLWVQNCIKELPFICKYTSKNEKSDNTTLSELKITETSATAIESTTPNDLEITETLHGPIKITTPSQLENTETSTGAIEITTPSQLEITETLTGAIDITTPSQLEITVTSTGAIELTTPSQLEVTNTSTSVLEITSLVTATSVITDSTHLGGRPSLSRFREDYIYSVNTNSYYKFHNYANWWDAVAKCKSEEAQLFYPENEAEAKEVDKILQLCADNPIDRCYPIWIGISDLRLNYFFETVDGRPMEEVYHVWDLVFKQPVKEEGYHCVIMWHEFDYWVKNCNNGMPFICKHASKSQTSDYTTPRKLEIIETSEVAIEPTTPSVLDITGTSSAVVNETTTPNQLDILEITKNLTGALEIISLETTTSVNINSTHLGGRPNLSRFREDYTYSVNTNSYYKFHNDTNWWDAVAKCKSEGAQLFYPEDEAEAKEVHKILQLCPDNSIDRCYPIWIGISDLRLHDVFETVDGRPMDEVHHLWDSEFKQPIKEDGYHCVIMWNKFNFWVYRCTITTPFICKHTSKYQTSDNITTRKLEIIETSAIEPKTPRVLNITGTSSAVVNETTTASQLEILEIINNSTGALEISTLDTTTSVNINSTHFGGRPSLSRFREDYTYSVNTNNYYKLHNDANWWDAVAKCKSEGAQLFYPEDEVQAKEVDKILQLCADNPTNTCYPIWIGVSDLRLNYFYDTVDGRPVDKVYYLWNLVFKLPVKEEGYNCVIMCNEFDFSVQKCNSEMPYICKHASKTQKSDITTHSKLEIIETLAVAIEPATPRVLDITGTSSSVVNETTTPNQFEILEITKNSTGALEITSLDTTTSVNMNSTHLSGRVTKPEFRADYTYSEKTSSYYKYHNQTNWLDAVAKCKSEGAQLYYPEDEAEAREVDEILYLNSCYYMWIGVSDLRSHGVYETIDGRPLDEVHNKWDVGQPIKTEGYHCVIMWDEYELWIIPCDVQHHFICKYFSRSSQESDVGYTTPSKLEVTEMSSTGATEKTTPNQLENTEKSSSAVTIGETTPSQLEITEKSSVAIEETTPSQLEIKEKTSTMASVPTKLR